MEQLIMGNVEDWLLKICCDKGTDVRMKIRKDRSPAEPTMSGLRAAAQAVFDEADRKHVSFPNLTGHGILNWPRHTATAGKLGLSGNDLETFWEHFKLFRDHFAGKDQGSTS
ncbi:MAG: hypothetical protein IAG10_32065 [Planctomycetaceae bacterium]|nr:hypothetical protein [Planctomycetaceae bacterium]